MTEIFIDTVKQIWDYLNDLGDFPTALLIAIITLVTGYFLKSHRIINRFLKSSVFYDSNSISNNEINSDSKYYVPNPFVVKKYLYTDQKEDYCEIQLSNDKKNSVELFYRQLLLDVDKKFKGNQFLVILGPSGVGKSMFLYQLFLMHKRKSRFKNSKRILLGKCSDPGSLFWKEVKRCNNEFSEIEKKQDSYYLPKNNILLIDGFDEDKLTFGGKEKNRLNEIIKLTKYFHKVVLVSRIQFFDGIEEQPSLEGKEVNKRFVKIELSDFSSGNLIEEYLNKRKWVGISKDRLNKFLRNLDTDNRSIYGNPFVLSNIDAIIDGKDEDGKPLKYFYDIYNAIINQWIQREFDKIQGGTKFIDKLTEQLTNKTFARYRNSDDYDKYNIEDLLLQYKSKEDFETFGKSDRTLLRFENNSFHFAHRSILEFFIAKELLHNSVLESDFDFSGFEMSAKMIFGVKWKEATKSYGIISLTNAKDAHDFILSISTNETLHKVLDFDLNKALIHQDFIEYNVFQLNTYGHPKFSPYFTIGYFRNLTSLNLMQTQITDAGLEILNCLTKLQMLYLSHTQITDAGLKHLKRLGNLMSLSLSQTQITDAGLEHLKGLSNLTTLQLDGKITDLGLEHLKGLRILAILSLCNTQITDAGLEHLKDLRNLTSLSLQQTQITNLGLKNLKDLSKLEHLYLHNTQITDTGLGLLKGLTNLQLLSLHFTQITDAGLEHLKGLVKLNYLSLPAHSITDLGLEILKDLSKLEHLILNGTKTTDLGLEHLKGLSNLITLDLQQTQIADLGLEHLKGLSILRILNLSYTQITDIGLEHLKGLTNLHQLDLNYTKITGTGLVHLKGLRILRILNLSYTQITDIGLEHLKGLTNLHRLDLNYTQITDTGLEHLKGLRILRILNLGHTQITNTGLEHIKGLANLQQLNLDYTKITDTGLGLLKGLTNLHRLDLNYTQITDKGLEHLKGLSNLKTLVLSQTQITDKGLEHLKGLSNLTTLALSQTRITDAGIQQLKHLTSLKIIP